MLHSRLAWFRKAGPCHWNTLYWGWERGGRGRVRWGINGKIQEADTLIRPRVEGDTRPLASIPAAVRTDFLCCITGMPQAWCLRALSLRRAKGLVLGVDSEVNLLHNQIYLMEMLAVEDRAIFCWTYS